MVNQIKTCTKIIKSSKLNKKQNIYLHGVYNNDKQLSKVGYARYRFYVATPVVVVVCSQVVMQPDVYFTDHKVSFIVSACIFGLTLTFDCWKVK